MNKLWYMLCLVLFITIGTNSNAQQRRWSPKAKNAVIGAGAGAVIGALVDKKSRGAGALIGGAIGGGAGYLYGRHRVHEMAEDRRERESMAYYRRNRSSWSGRSNGYTNNQGYLMSAQSNAAYGTANGNAAYPLNYYSNPVYGYQAKSW